MASTEETLDEKLARERLNAALSLQYRSALGYTLASGSLFGFEYQALGDRLWEYGQANWPMHGSWWKRSSPWKENPPPRSRRCAGRVTLQAAVNWLIETKN